MSTTFVFDCFISLRAYINYIESYGFEEIPIKLLALFSRCFIQAFKRRYNKTYVPYIEDS